MPDCVRCLFLIDGLPLGPHANGGSGAVGYEAFNALVDAGHEVHLWRFSPPAQGPNGPPPVDLVEGRAASITVRAHPADNEPKPIRVFRAGQAFLRGQPRGAASPRGKNLSRLVDELAPDVIWANHTTGLSLALTQRQVPVLYGQRDWLYRIHALRQNRPERARDVRAERRLVARADGAVTGSFTEAQELRELGLGVVEYIPVSYPDPGPPTWSDGHEPAVIHLGSMHTTASRQGLAEFLQQVWPTVGLEPDRLVVIGELSGADAELSRRLEHATCTGFVDDLSEHLRAGDIHVIPWEHSTGQRTRLPLAFSFGQAVVACKAGVSCYPEARDGVNCVLVDRVEDTAPAIRTLLARPDERRRLGEAARTTFAEAFTRQALVERYSRATVDVANRQRGISG